MHIGEENIEYILKKLDYDSIQLNSHSMEMGYILKIYSNNWIKIQCELNSHSIEKIWDAYW
jgi:hypothetical protein